MRKIFRRIGLVFVALFSLTFLLTPEISLANTVTPTGKLTPPKETFTPGTWFLGATPPNLVASRPPIVFVQGKNGSSTSWYGETVYHGTNDMYERAYNAGYQTVFVQLYDAAGSGSENQYKNGQLLATMLQKIYTQLGNKKLNIVAHSKGGPDTQAALVQYGAHQYVGRVITLGSPHHGSNLADLSYSWYAGWLGELLGQQDAGTYSLQTGEMAKFRTATDSNANSRKNKYYTVAGTDWGPAFSALATGGLYLSSYGSNDGLVNEWSAKLSYGTHLFTDKAIDHDNIRTGTKVFSRIEPYLRTATVSNVPTIESDYSERNEMVKKASLQTVHGGPLSQKDWVEYNLFVDNEKSGSVTVYTATKDTFVEFVSPSGKVFSSTRITSDPSEDRTIFKGATIYQFQQKNMEKGNWKVRMISENEKDAYFLTADTSSNSPLTLEIPTYVKGKDVQFYVKTSDTLAVKDTKKTFTIFMTDEERKVVVKPISVDKLDSSTYLGVFPDVEKAGLYNVTIDVNEKISEGSTITRSFVSSIYIEK